MNTAIKICGVRDADTMRACVEAGVEYVGLNFAPGSRRAVDVEEARSLIALAGPERPQMVGVFRDCPVALVAQIASRVGLDIVQLHGREPVAACAQLAAELPVIKALSFDALGADAAAYARVASRLLIDGRRPGSGEAWAYAPFSGAHRAFLAGGLHPGNVGAAIDVVRPYAVDTASGVEVNGVPEPDRVFAFVRAARAAAMTQPGV